MATSHVRLDFAVSKSRLVPFNSTICPRNGPKRRQKAPKSAQCAPTPRNQARAVSWATWLKIRFRGHLVHPQAPTFCGFQAAELPNETPRPPYQWSLCVAGGQHSPRTKGANGGSTRVPGAKKIIFSKVVPRPLGMLKQVFLARFEPVVTRFGPWKIPKCLENGPIQDQKIYIYIYIYPPIYTPLPNSRWLHHTALMYVRRAQNGAYMWWKGLNAVKMSSKWAKNTCVSIPNGPGSLLE